MKHVLVFVLLLLPFVGVAQDNPDKKDTGVYDRIGSAQSRSVVAKVGCGDRLVFLGEEKSSDGSIISYKVRTSQGVEGYVGAQVLWRTQSEAQKAEKDSRCGKLLSVISDGKSPEIRQLALETYRAAGCETSSFALIPKEHESETKQVLPPGPPPAPVAQGGQPPQTSTGRTIQGQGMSFDATSQSEGDSIAYNQAVANLGAMCRGGVKNVIRTSGQCFGNPGIGGFPPKYSCTVSAKAICE
jgi:hypothetical protein